MEKLQNPVRGYAWGSRSVLAELQRRPVPSPGPEAELWIGAHPADPSRTADGTPLTEVIGADPDGVLGAATAARFGPRLPYLLKVLAAEQPLSLQAHPDPEQAQQGYAAEEAAGVPRDAPQRRYADPYHKPELLVATSEFRALCGFREPGESAELLGHLGLPALAPVVAALAGGDLAAAVRLLLTAPQPAQLVRAVVAATDDPLTLQLAAAYPQDLGVVVALLLNRVTLAPGEGIFMPAGNLHAYLHGTGVEIMAASDNVLRGGLTPKFVDVPELLRVLRYEPLVDPVQRAVPVRPGVATWPVPVAEFALHRVRLADGGGPASRVELDLPGPRVVLGWSGRVQVDDGVRSVTLLSGDAALARGSTVGPLRFTGIGEAYVASGGDGDFRESLDNLRR